MAEVFCPIKYAAIKESDHGQVHQFCFSRPRVLRDWSLGRRCISCHKPFKADNDDVCICAETDPLDRHKCTDFGECGFTKGEFSHTRSSA